LTAGLAYADYYLIISHYSVKYLHLLLLRRMTAIYIHIHTTKNPTKNTGATAAACSTCVLASSMIQELA